ncbi:argonaute/piwi family protein [Achromobacter ruhlandii]|uniref:Protein argonaute n=2 Tax=Achromobacter ruhlandii TaxID=72557 RepID=A0ABM8LP09_9BURK|nr:Piwi domain-containing protein [Achromobacter ruhlandii]AKP92230.1 Piwi domain protein [Achromobacter xylosoxidans]AOU95491.1 piwi domain-containing protein [Achromobacter ruhlandii]MCZ8434100.1 Piwi domain-containing protein [Achromobacter ruhlandii]MDC6152867.1 Piwi domain-containing protein [Achromobacter ruhlandii]MDD7980597.1 Piwi domain-containing protein [Achromobacter ruhlandii]
MQLNHLPITFSAQRFSGFRIQYQSGDHLRTLRHRLVRTHFVLRAGDNILLFPYERGAKTEGQTIQFDITADHSVANALARQALLRSFFVRGRSISGVRPVRIVRENSNLLSGKGADTFAVFPEYSFDVRPLAPQEGTFVNGVLVNFGARLLIMPSVAQLIDRGLDPVGLYVVGENDVDDPYILPMFNRRLVGRIERIDGDDAILADARQERVALSQAHVEPSRLNFERVGRKLLGSAYEAFQRQMLPRLHEVSAAQKQLARLEQIVGTFKDLQGELPCCVGLSISLDGHLTEVSQGIGVGLSRKLHTPQCSLRPGGSITVPWPVDPKLDANGPFDADSFEHKQPRVAVLFPIDQKGHVQRFAAQLRDGVPSQNGNTPMQQGMVRKYRLQSLDFEFVEVDTRGGEKAPAYRQAALAAVQRNVDVALVVITDEDRLLLGAQSPYFTAKAVLMSQGVPVQAVRLATILQNNVAYSLNNLALGLYAKLGGIPWTLSVQQRLVHEIVVGIGSARIGFDRLSERERLVGITTVFSGDGNYLLGNATTEATADQYQVALLNSLRMSLDELKRRFGWRAGDKLRIIFHQAFKRYKETEAQAVESLVNELREFEVEYAFVQVSGDHDWKLFDASSQGAVYRQSRKGIAVPERGQIVPLGPRAALVTLTGPQQLKTDLQGCPSPMLVSVHPNSTFSSLDYIAKQVFDLTFMSWRTFMPSTHPVSIAYPNLVVDLLANLRLIQNFNPDILITKLKESRWFL